MILQHYIIFFDKETKWDDESTSSCKPIHRVISGLLYYQNNNDHFIDFLLSVYPHYLDDIIHLKTHHTNNDDLEFINNIILSHSQ